MADEKLLSLGYAGLERADRAVAKVKDVSRTGRVRMSSVNCVAKLLARLDRVQRRHPVLGLPFAVVYKFFDDQGNYLAVILIYYAFVAIFPLLLIASSVLGFVLHTTRLFSANYSIRVSASSRSSVNNSADQASCKAAHPRSR